MNRHISEESSTPDASGRQKADGAKAIAEGGEEVKERARDAARDAAEAGKERLEAGSGRAAESVDDVADAIGAAASRLGELEHEGLADYADRMASYLDDISGKLRDKSVDELVDDVRNIAERNPAVFLLGSVAIGLGVSRFAKASRERRRLDGAGRDTGWREASETPRPQYSAEERSSFESRITPDTTGGSGL